MGKKYVVIEHLIPLIPHYSILFFKKIIYVKRGEMGGAPVCGLTTNAYNGKSWARLKPGDRISTQISHIGGRN